ncbi:MAG: hypothetical protein WCO00_17655 [Rhodospirillaceae bacterium]
MQNKVQNRGRKKFGLGIDRGQASRTTQASVGRSGEGHGEDERDKSRKGLAVNLCYNAFISLMFFERKKKRKKNEVRKM